MPSRMRANPETMDRKELLAEIRRLNGLLIAARKRAVAQYAVIDKLTAASLRVQFLLTRLRGNEAGPRTRLRRQNTAPQS
jgi:hypothetical protein